MKNMKKFITLCGFLILGSIACGDVDIVKAEAINNQAADTSGYTITIPSDVDIDNDSGKGSFAVTGKVKAQSTIDVSIQSKNGYKLKDKNGELPYSIDKKSFSIDNSRSASDIPLNEEFNIVSKTNTKVSGYYTDSLTFDITGKKHEYRLDVNGSLDGGGAGDGTLSGYGIFDMYVDGKLVKKDADDFCQCIPYGSVWELKNIRSLDGYHYEESVKVPTKGVIGENVEDITSTYRTTHVNLKFYTNKLTINYHADGATKLLDWSTKPESYKDISGVDIFHSTTDIYGAAYSNGVAGLTDAYRLSGKQGYKVLDGYWKINKTGEQKYSDNIGFKNTENCAEYLGVLKELNKGDVTIDLYPIWEPLLNTITYDANGGTLSTAKTQQFYTGTSYKAPENSKSFSGTSTDDCEDLGYYNYLFGNKLTISTKIRFNSSDDTLPQKLQEFFCNYEWGGFGLGLGEDARPFFSVFRENKDNYDILHSKTKIKPNETYWITSVYDGPNNTMSIYINGEKTNTVQLSTTDNSNIKVSPLGLSLGGNPTGGCQYSNLTKGDIWKCGLWQNALSDEEVMKMYKTDTLAEGSFISRDFSAPKKNYYLFDGWYTQPTGGDKITTGSIIKSSMTLYAHYKPIRSFVNYDSNGGNGTMQSEEFLSSNKTNLSKNTFTKDGYTFKGWLASRIYKSNEEYMYVNPNGGGGWFEKGKQPSGWSKLYLLSDQEAIYMASAYDGLTLTFHAQWEKAYSAGDTLDIEGTKYVVLKQKENNQALVITANIIGNRAFQSKTRDDGTDIRTYEGSEIDNYLENDWYNNLSPTMKNAIQMTDINQIGYYNLFNVGKYNSLISLVSVPDPGSGPNPSPDTPDIKKEDKIYNKISRHVYLPSIADIGNVVDLNSLPSIRIFLNGTSFWTRDHSRPTPISDNVYTFNADSMRPGMLENTQTKALTGVRPAFVIDLSKVNYTVTGTINSK